MKPIPLLTALMCFSTFLAAAEGKRVALVIGNGAYTHVPTLANPTNDSREISKLLRTAGYEVTEVTDGTVKEMGVALRTFAIAGREAEAAVFYFAGHGFEVGGKNYLAPVDAELAVDENLAGDELDAALGFALDAETVPLDGVLGEMRKQMTGLKIVVLDCCRNNPFAGTRSWARSRSGGGGLAQVTEAELPEGTMLVFSGEPGQEVPDGTGDHSPFAEALLGEMKGSGQAPVLTVFTGVATKVKGRQKPWIKFDGTGRSLHAFSTVSLMTRGVPVAVKAAEADPAMSEAEIERRAKEMAEKLVAEAMRKQPVPAMPATAPAAPVMPTETPKPMVKTDPVPAPAYPADRGMEGTQAGEVRTFGGIEMVWCPPGEFLMGSPEDEVGRDDDETQHRVTLTSGFWMAKTETTQAQWERVIGYNPSHYKGSDRPVETVSWDDVQEWIEKMNEISPLPSGWKWALPTERQWEYACRAGTKTPFSGVGEIKEMGWCFDTLSIATATVATKKANDWGLYDMHGNVREWCGDGYELYSSGSATEPNAAGPGDWRVARGGSWGRVAKECRSASRDRELSETSIFTLGFRPVLTPPDMGSPSSQSVVLNANSDPIPTQAMVKSEQVLAPAFPADRSMEGSRAGEVREFGGIEMVWCPPGEFLMGSPEDEEGRSDDETQHRVTLTRGFWMAKTETTQGQWERVMGVNPSLFKDSENAVDNVSWNDVQVWLQKMNELHSQGSSWSWALPMECQWEYACRAGTTTAISGTGDLDEMGWFEKSTGRKGKLVATKRSNSWGLNDMHGNVEEWCADWYDDYEIAPTNDPKGPASGTKRVLRGGSEAYPFEFCRSASRSQKLPEKSDLFVGFRPVLVPSNP